MLTTIRDAVLQLLPAKRKTSVSGWTSFNAVCCEHTGESRDNRGRGGLIANPNGSISYSCFNCGFKANYTPGRHLNYKFRKLLSWFGADENSIKRLVIDAIRVKELVNPEELKEQQQEEVSFNPRPLPLGAKSFSEWTTFLALTDDNYVTPESLKRAVEYVDHRGGNLLSRYEFYTTEDDEHNMHKRVIVPCYWKGQLIGSTSRTFEDGIKPKYYADYEPNYVFNMDRQTPEKKFVIVVEGPFDAMAVDGVAVLSNECSEIQADIIDSLGREVIVVPDFDSKLVKGKNVWAGSKLVEQAIEFGWSVSFPIWNESVKDVSAAVEKYGKLFTLKAILEGKQSSRLKIELHKKRIHS
jgi:5S rRNA maturation endonuclease (ribonuclease M5)